MEAGRYQDAIPVYQHLVQALPNNPGLLLNLGLALHMAGRESEAIQKLATVTRSQPKLIPALIALADAHLALNRPYQAAEQYRKLTDLSPQDPRAWYGLGHCYELMAGAAFDRLRSISADSPYVAVLIADTRVQRHQYNSAFFFYREALKRLPDLHGVHGALADVYRKTGHADWAAVEDGKEQALPVPDCHAHAAECDFIGGHDLQALNARPAPQPPETLYWQAKAANELALQAFFTLGNLPPSVELYQLKAEIARNHNQHLEAVKEWRAALVLAPGNTGLRQELAASLFMAQDFQAAIDEASALLRANPKSPELNFILGDSYLRLEQPGKSVPYLEAALASDPKLLAAHASLGLVLSRLDKNAEAIPHLERALALDDDGNLHYQLARAYQAAGAREKASTTMAQYQEIVKKNQEQKEEVARTAQIVPPQ